MNSFDHSQSVRWATPRPGVPEADNPLRRSIPLGLGRHYDRIDTDATTPRGSIPSLASTPPAVRGLLRKRSAGCRRATVRRWGGALGLKLINYVPVTGVPLAILVAAAGLGLLVATVWAAGLGQPAVAAMLSLSTLRLPSSIRAIFFPVELILALAAAGYINADASLLKAAGVSAFGAIGAYVLFDIASQATGGPGVPLGQPILRSGQ